MLESSLHKILWHLASTMLRLYLGYCWLHSSASRFARIEKNTTPKGACCHTCRRKLIRGGSVTRFCITRRSRCLPDMPPGHLSSNTWSRSKDLIRFAMSHHHPSSVHLPRRALGTTPVDAISYDWSDLIHFSGKISSEMFSSKPRKDQMTMGTFSLHSQLIFPFQDRNEGCPNHQAPKLSPVWCGGLKSLFSPLKSLTYDLGSQYPWI